MMSRRPWTLKRTRAGVLAMGALLAALFPHDRSEGFSFYMVDSVKVTWPQSQSVRYLSPGTFPPGSAAETAVIEALALWNIVPATTFQYSISRLEQDVAIDHFDGFNDTAAVSAGDLDPGVLGVTYLVNDGPFWFDMDVVFSDSPSGAGYTFELNPTCDVISQPVPFNGYAFLLIALHEFGHALGLGHDPIGDEPAEATWFPAVMNPRYPGGGPLGDNHIVELHADDRAGLRLLYPHSGPSLPHVVDLASGAYAPSSIVGKTQPLVINPSVVYPGSEVVAQSVIENLGTSNEFYVRQTFYLSPDSTVDSRDMNLGSLFWDMAAGDQFVFDVAFDLPDDMPAGTYYLGSKLDEGNEVAEQFEDNNEVTYCAPLTILQRAPVVELIPQQVVSCGSPFSAPPPNVTLPLNMAPITWSLVGAPAGMTINPATGAISWPAPVASPFLYAINVRAENAEGVGSQSFFLGVSQRVPDVQAIPDERASCQQAYAGPRPQLDSPACMEPILSWTLASGPAGMTINASNGAVSWALPLPSASPYPITVRVANASGIEWVSWFLTIAPGDLTGDAFATRADGLLLGPCLKGPGRIYSGSCRCADYDADGDIDLRDLAEAGRTLP